MRVRSSAEASFWCMQMVSGPRPLKALPSSLCRHHTHHSGSGGGGGIQMPAVGCLSLPLSPHILDTRSTPARNSLCATTTSHRWRTTTAPLPFRSWRDPSATSSPACRPRASGRSGRCVGPELRGVRAELHSTEALGYSSAHQC